jgi:hypothetical protein
MDCTPKCQSTSSKKTGEVGRSEIAPAILRLSKYIDMTIHWKALEEHFLMVPLVFLYNLFQGECFLKKSQVKIFQNNAAPLMTF